MGAQEREEEGKEMGEVLALLCMTFPCKLFNLENVVFKQNALDEWVPCGKW